MTWIVDLGLRMVSYECCTQLTAETMRVSSFMRERTEEEDARKKRSSERAGDILYLEATAGRASDRKTGRGTND